MTPLGIIITTIALAAGAVWWVAEWSRELVRRRERKRIEAARKQERFHWSMAISDMWWHAIDDPTHICTRQCPCAQAEAIRELARKHLGCEDGISEPRGIACMVRDIIDERLRPRRRGWRAWLLLPPPEEITAAAEGKP